MPGDYNPIIDQEPLLEPLILIFLDLNLVILVIINGLCPRLRYVPKNGDELAQAVDYVILIMIL